MGVLEIVMVCETEFPIVITDEEASRLVTVGDLIRLVESKLGL